MGFIYFIGAAALASNVKPKVFQALGILYTVVLIGLYFYMGSFNTIGYIDKALEVVLIINLAWLILRSPKPVAPKA